MAALKKIGIYNLLEIDLISKYFESLKRSQSNLKKLFLAGNNYQQKTRILITKLSLVTTLIHGLVCVFFLSSKFSSKKYNQVRKEYIRDYYRIINDFKKQFSYDKSLYILDNILCNDLINRLKYARKIYKQINRYKINCNRESIYICRALLKHNITTIDKSTNSPIVVIEKKDNIVVFGKSKEESITTCKRRFKSFIDDENSQIAQNYPSANKLAQSKIDSLIEEAKYEAHIISP